jgi:propanol-preferring alcohol dehydrogenase
MRAALLRRIAPVVAGSAPLDFVDVPDPRPGRGEMLIRIAACGVCHTELDEIEGRMPPPRLPVIPGHQVVGIVAVLGPGASRFSVGDRVGVAWIASSCGTCPACHAGNENLCPSFAATGRDINGGYAEQMTIHEDFAHPIPSVFTDSEAAPLLCAGAIGYRSLRLCGLNDGELLGLMGFGASAHLVLTMARHRYPRSAVYVFARNVDERSFARELGAAWTGDVGEAPPHPLRCIIDTTPAWTPVLEALTVLSPGGRLVINAIRKETGDISVLTRMNYPAHLWMEKEVKSVANVTRRDVTEFLTLAAEAGIRPAVQEFALSNANRALIELKDRRIRGAKVLRIP